MSKGELSAKVIGQISLMQSVVASLPDKPSMLRLSCEGFRDLPGVSSVIFYIGDETEGGIESAPNGAFRVFPVKRRDHLLAEFRFDIEDLQRFHPYEPYIGNFCSMLSVIFEERDQRELNRKLMADLEMRIDARTRDLQEEIRERARAEEALRQSERNLSTTLDSIGDAVISTDLGGLVVRMNPVACQLTGWDSDEAAGRSLSEVFHIVQAHTRRPAENPVDKVLESGKIVGLANHTILIAKNGREYHIADSAAPIRDETQGTTGVVLVFRDVTAERRTEEMLRNNQRLESLAVLAGGIAHDFNNLLAGVYGNLDMANEIMEDSEGRSYLAIALKSMERARNLTQQLLTFAKGGAPRKELAHPGTLIRESIQFALSGSPVACRFHIAEDLHACEIDQQQMGQVLDNLAINARQAMPEGGTLYVSARNRRVSRNELGVHAAGDYVEIAVRDEGCGIEKENIPHIFDPFFTTKPQGHGLGLSSCHSIVSKHEGFILVQSEPGKGTTMSIYLPASLQAAAEESSAHTRDTHVGKGTVLLMDDEDLVRDSMAAMLRRMGYTPVCHGNGHDALRYLNASLKEKTPLAAAILDLTISGGMGGKEAIEEIRKLAPHLPVFVASGYCDDPVMASPHAFGFTASIAKPFRKQELEKLFRTHVLQ